MKKSQESNLPWSLYIFSVLVTRPWAWPDDVITSVTDREKIETHEITELTKNDEVI